MKMNRRLIVLSVSAFLLLTTAPAAGAQPPAHVLERAKEAVEIGKDKAKSMAEALPGQANRARGLERAAEALAAAAERKAAREGTDHPGKGRALGRGHADAVHEMLLSGGSPSDLPPHGRTVSALAKAFAKVRGDRPGLGHGRDKPGKHED